ncbi:MAG: aminoacyl-tRNA hydrolase [Nonlabens sp.]
MSFINKLWSVLLSRFRESGTEKKLASKSSNHPTENDSKSNSTLPASNNLDDKEIITFTREKGGDKDLSKFIGATHETPHQENATMKKFLIIGLGNIGSEYAETRHNIGFKIVDEIASSKEASFETLKLGDVATIKHKGKSIVLLKPSTYMNLSGKAIKYYMNQEGIPIDQILVITDDLNLPFGTLRMKGKGTDGGHNGLKDTQITLNTPKYPRLRFGISAEYSKGRQVDYVLGEWNSDERAALPERLETAAQMALAFTHAGLANAMNQYNGK